MQDMPMQDTYTSPMLASDFADTLDRASARLGTLAATVRGEPHLSRASVEDRERAEELEEVVESLTDEVASMIGFCQSEAKAPDNTSTDPFAKAVTAVGLLREASDGLREDPIAAERLGDLSGLVECVLGLEG